MVLAMIPVKRIHRHYVWHFSNAYINDEFNNHGAKTFMSFRASLSTGK